ncbi:MAG: hypothetical protein AAGG09_19925 [Pseudomonadota bacterium]
MGVKPSSLVADWDKLVKNKNFEPMSGGADSVRKVIDRYGGHVGKAVAETHAGLAKADKAMNDLQTLSKSLPRQCKIVQAEYKRLSILIDKLKGMLAEIEDKEAQLKRDSKNKELKKEVDGLIKAYKATEKLALQAEKSINTLNDSMQDQHAAACDASEAALIALGKL